MRRVTFLLCASFLLALFLLATAHAQSAAGAAQLPVKKVVLYKTGVGYFEHVGKVRGDQEFTVDFTTAQLNDVLKSLTIVDSGGGHVAAVRYNSVAPIAERLRTLRLSLGEHSTTADLLSALRGTKVEVQSGAGTFAGSVLAVERKATVGSNGAATSVDELSIITVSGQLRRFELTPAVTVRIADAELGQELARYLSVVGSARSRDFRRMAISTRGTGERQLSLSYISEVPVWKSTYRLVLADDVKKPAVLQGWAVVDNTIGEDWRGVRLSLVAGAPQSFVQEISQPYYVRRPVVQAPSEVSLMPQAHEGTMEVAAAVPFVGGVSIRTSLRGVVTDPQGAVVSGARVTLRAEATGETQSTMTDSYGSYVFERAPVGSVSLSVDANNFAPARMGGIFLAGGQLNQVSVPLAITAASTTVEVVASGGVSVETQTQELVNSFSGNADAARRGDMFEYAITQPVTVAKNQSALVPIVQGEIHAEKVTLWNESRPQALLALWVKNDTGLTLDGGAFEVLDHDAFAGEGIMATLHPEERRLLSYAADTAVSVVEEGRRARSDDDEDEDDDANQPAPGQVATRIRIEHGNISITREQRATATYAIHNADTMPRTVVIEQPLRAQWKLIPGTTPEEISTQAYRFKQTVAAGATQRLVVTTMRPDESSYMVTTITDEQVALFVKDNAMSAGTAQALQGFVAKKRNIAVLDVEAQAKNKEMESINGDQARLRENMKALRGSSEERTLLQRYTRQLNAQEDRIEALRAEMARLKARREEMQAELAAAIEAFAINESR
ncbi:MAG: carboxypeptidase regulatory-like domain-containing protein [Candidatus Koribacter versatilis]|uniref:Carboxypeptidase regulatory-like domain-containing protein n=1 Tax=Candidatus Korobacter versatilis TaxID=658062 RepID=A0A932A9D2_9BACT|nr:carboxypeptidase regulatory-like domain-containing protein [Candidatus Koribacter versatilis]